MGPGPTARTASALDPAPSMGRSGHDRSPQPGVPEFLIWVPGRSAGGAEGPMHSGRTALIGVAVAEHTKSNAGRR